MVTASLPRSWVISDEAEGNQGKFGITEPQ
jgi:hypothetical protein